MKKILENLRDKKTLIVATLGSSSETEEKLEKMILAGLNIVRINMNHGNLEEHHEQIITARKVAKRMGVYIDVLVDLAGPKVHVGQMEANTILEEGKKVILTNKKCVGNTKCIFISYLKLPEEIKKGQNILISDGKKILEVLSTNGKDEVVCKIIAGGLVTSNRGVNIPGLRLSLPVISNKDKQDVKFAIEHRADYVALSFVKKSKDVDDLRKLLILHNSKALIISKIETQEALDELEEIIKVSDGIMVARGDLAMEIGIHNIPVAQRRIVEISKKLGKMSIVATQVLDSMEKNPVPTRAEVTDIATAIFEGASGVMLSGESAIGKYPVEAIQVISRVAKSCEESEYYNNIVY